MDVDLERILSEDEAARAGVARSTEAARQRVETERGRLDEERKRRLQRASAQVDEGVARILGEAEHEVVQRRKDRERWTREQAARREQLLDTAAELFSRIVRDGPQKKAS